MADDDDARRVEELLDTPDLAGALDSERFKQFLDHIPVAIAVSELQPEERISYVNIEFERITGHAAAAIQGRPWTALQGNASTRDGSRRLSDAVTDGDDYIGTFAIERADADATVDAWSNIIIDDDGRAIFRLVAFAEIGQRAPTDQEELERRVREKDTLLRELQHRVKNNLQMITALIRLESRNLPDDAAGERFSRLAGRVESLALLYSSLSEDPSGESIDLGVYISQIASTVMRSLAVEGIRLDLQVDTWPVSINVAMPTGLVVNELLTNAMKHAFVGRDSGTITLHCLVDDDGCRMIVADDGVGLAEGAEWPRSGKLSALIVQSLRQNAKAQVEVASSPGNGVRATIFFARANAEPEANS